MTAYRSLSSLTAEGEHVVTAYEPRLRVVARKSTVGFLDVINVYSGPNTNSVEWDPRRGVNVVEEGDAFPLIGIILERAW